MELTKMNDNDPFQQKQSSRIESEQLTLKEQKSLGLSQLEESSCESEDPTEYWRAAQHLGNTVKIRDDRLKQHFVNIQNQYVTKVSDSSCRIEDITGILYGGISSRFWLYRKEIIYQDCQFGSAIADQDLSVHKHYKLPKNDPKAPFLCWECVTLELANGRTIDLVIKNEADMMNFIKYLLWKLDNINNRQRTSTKVEQALANLNFN